MRSVLSVLSPGEVSDFSGAGDDGNPQIDSPGVMER